jgi:hypothetical protein
MTDMQTSLPLLTLHPSILNLVIHISTHLCNACWLYLYLAQSIPSSPMLMQHMYQHHHKWYDPLHIMMWRIGSSILTSLALHCCIGPSVPSHYSSMLPCGPMLSLWLALHTCNRSIKPSLVLIFSTESQDSMSCLICNELLHHIITCELITYVFYSNTY